MRTVSLYIYYRVTPDTADPGPVEDLVCGLASRFGCEGTLLQRADDALTWMEVYRDVAEPDALLADRAALWTRGGHRPPVAGHHVERFVPLACA